MKKLIFMFMALAFVAIAIPTFAAGSKGFVSPNEVPAGFDVYVRASSGQFPGKGDVVFVKKGLNPKIAGFILADNPERVKEIILNSTDPNLSPVKNRSTGEIIAYGWGKFTYKSVSNRIEAPSPGGGNGGRSNSNGGPGGSGAP